MRLLEKEEKIAFMKALYTFAMRDDKYSPKEKKLLVLFRDIVFKFDQEGIKDHEWMVNLGGNFDAIVSEIEKIKDCETKEKLLLIFMEITHNSERTSGFIIKTVEEKERDFIKQLIDRVSLKEDVKERLYKQLEKI